MSVKRSKLLIGDVFYMYLFIRLDNVIVDCHDRGLEYPYYWHKTFLRTTSCTNLNISTVDLPIANALKRAADIVSKSYHFYHEYHV